VKKLGVRDGAAARVNMGVVIASGLSIGTMFTLFVVPAFYMLLSSVKAPKTTVRSDPVV
jgi:multidrug efflux pump